MFALVRTKAFMRDVRVYLKRGGDEKRLEAALRCLRYDVALPQGFLDHQLHGKLSSYRELHVEHDWLLVYHRDGKKLIVTCLWLVSHQKLRQRQRGA